ncbi:MAG: flagellar basal body rod protein FlgB [Alphaproteobacteria bacterium]|nr:flagellar basal body rod protein FlgB [Alphaproteobacteria bacterium]
MGFGADSGILSLMKDRMSYLGQRSKVLAQNVANANTPNYKAKEIAPFRADFAKELQRINPSMTVTNPAHIMPASMAGVNAGTKPMKSYEVVPSKNDVDLEQQMLAVSETTIEYQANASIFQKFVGLLRAALGSG